MKRTAFFLSSLAMSLLMTIPAYAADSYKFVDLGTLGGAASSALGINSNGQIVGFAQTASSIYHAFIYENGIMSDIGSLGGDSLAYDINDHGDIVGYFDTKPVGDYPYHAYIYHNGSTIDLGTFGRTDGSARSINNVGQVAVNASGSNDSMAGLLNGTSYVSLGTLGGTQSGALEINDSGHIVGYSTLAGDKVSHAFIYKDGLMHDLGALGGKGSVAYSVNCNDQVVGYLQLDRSITHVFLYSNNTMHDLGTLGGSYGEAYSINSWGNIVGISTDANGISHPFYYSDGTMRNLEESVSIPDGWSYLIPKAINDNGQIIGTGRINGYERAFLLTPIPEPSTLSLLVMGGIGIAFGWRRRKTHRIVVCFIALLVSSAGLAQAITIDTVPVSDINNAADTTGYGSVDHAYNIGKYEVTARQYTEFLNAVGRTDTYGLYNTSMWSATYGCKIQRSGSSGSYVYSVASDYADFPVNYVSFWDACRFANWLNNNQPTGMQGSSTTETGAYTLTAAGIAANTISRNTTWKWAVTSENEWYKAAYYKGGSNHAGYWDYATQSDVDNPPSNVLSAVGTNNANYYNSNYTDPVHRLTLAGAFAASPGPYGTFDQCGNVWEWDEAILYSSTRGLRGGAADTTADWLVASMRAGQGVGGPAAETWNNGFRVVSLAVPEPSTIALLGMCGIGLIAYGWRRARQTALCAVAIFIFTTAAPLSFGATIDSIDTSTIFGYTDTYTGNLILLGYPQQYHLSDGSQWSSGAGSFGAGLGTAVSESVQNGTVQYTMSWTNTDKLMYYTDYDNGEHSSQGVLAPYGPLVIEATVGSNTARMHGYAQIISNDITWYGEPRFNYYSAEVGQTVPFDVTYSLPSGTWQPGIFRTTFTYNLAGHIDFTHPVPEPSTLALLGMSCIGLIAYGWRRRCIACLMVFAIFSIVANTKLAQADVFNLGGTRNTDGTWGGLASLEMVPVGDPGNVSDSIGLGSVANSYLIGKFEVTNAQWLSFLTAKAAIGDPHGLYNSGLGYSSGIVRSGSGTTADPYLYTFKDTGWTNRPICNVSFWDAARFCNWLHNGQGNSDTETGAYTNIGDQAKFARQPDATYFIPTKNEWYKAAYYDPQKPGGPGYWDYPTRSDVAPINTLVTPDPGNHANFKDVVGTGNSGYTIGGPYYTTVVGDFENSMSSYGTFDQGGNVVEFTETYATSQERIARGGSWIAPSSMLMAVNGYLNKPADKFAYFGFRIAGVPVPEPSTIALLGMGGIGLIAYSWRRRMAQRIVVCFIALLASAVGMIRADTFGTGANQFTLDFVPISGATNPISGIPAGTNFTFAGVAYDYRMSTYEITNSQWNKFKTSLGVPITGTPSSAYDNNAYYTGTNVSTGCVSWYEAAQFVNWLNTSKGHQAAYKFIGTQGTSDYTFAPWDVADSGYDPSNPFRNTAATYFLPSENEWVKAAYWNGTSLQTYATKPGESLFQGTGKNGTGWNYASDIYAGLWAVGSGSQELNDTYDMMGNVWEWMEGPWISGDYGSTQRVARGGSYGDPFPSRLGSSYRNLNDASSENSSSGFRVASVPEPSTLALLFTATLGGLLWWQRKR